VESRREHVQEETKNLQLDGRAIFRPNSYKRSTPVSCIRFVFVRTVSFCTLQRYRVSSLLSFSHRSGLSAHHRVDRISLATIMGRSACEKAGDDRGQQVMADEGVVSQVAQRGYSQQDRGLVPCPGQSRVCSSPSTAATTITSASDEEKARNVLSWNVRDL
jgi:hypothetical protein